MNNIDDNVINPIAVNQKDKDFHGNFDGQNFTIPLEIDRAISSIDESISLFRVMG